MKRRTFLAGTAAAATLPRPSLAQGARVLKFIPEGNLANPDPIWTTTTVARNHGYMIYDTLFGVDSQLNAKPQMCQGFDLSADKLTWTFRLRDGLKFHNGAPVRGVDCVASIKRWMARDAFGQRLAMQLDSMTAPDDRSFAVKLSKPFPLLLTALGKAAANVCFIMPEHVAQTDPFTQITDFTGSGPFRFLRDEWKPGDLAAYARNEAYLSRDEAPDFTAGGKPVYFDRVEWNIISDSSTATGALQTGEEDWWQVPVPDLLPLLKQASGVKIVPMTRFGSVEILRFNELWPPFNNVKMRQAMLQVASQKEFMEAAYGDDTSLYKTDVGVFTPGSAAASTVGMAAVTGPRDKAAARKLVQESGYAGEKVVILSPTRDLLTQLGVAVDYVAADWGTVVQRRANKAAPDNGGWNVFCTGWEGLNVDDPAGHYPILGNGQSAWFGWPTSPRIEQLRTNWFDAADDAARKQATDAIQTAVWEEVPYVPLGQFFQPAAMKTTVTGVLDSPFPIFWNARKG